MSSPEATVPQSLVTDSATAPPTLDAAAFINLTETVKPDYESVQNLEVHVELEMEMAEDADVDVYDDLGYDDPRLPELII
ncbi:GH12422 [Drosophila grimshawi]|uniref:GH12422 n=1 Tax=Drosophila grimshawi TaxID=7222 RepID=B4JJ18_DROGR|nr:GH12422 [Drosophila grimshawi]